VADREPHGGLGRPTGDMNRPALGSPHADHDLSLIASAIDRDADRDLLAAADAQVAGCSDCADLLADLRAISAGLRELPKAVAVSRDFTISAEQARRLRRGAIWRRWLRPFASPGAPSLRPLATVLATLGLAGLLLTSGLPGFIGSAGGGLFNAFSTIGAAVPAQPEGQTSDKSAPTSPAAQPGSLNYRASEPPLRAITSPAPQTQASPQAALGPAAAPTDQRGSRLTADNSSGVAEPAASPSALAVISVVLVVVGIGLFVLRFVARRFT
jgi:hypothetical protein